LKVIVGRLPVKTRALLFPKDGAWLLPLSLPHDEQEQAD
jgi:hypothetical protein